MGDEFMYVLIIIVTYNNVRKKFNLLNVFDHWIALPSLSCAEERVQSYLS